MLYRYDILQVKDFENCKYTFMGYDFAQRHGFDYADYKRVYDGWEEIDTDNVYRALDFLFHKFNVNHPADFEGHSLSTSDVVVLDGVAYYCDSFGWEKID